MRPTRRHLLALAPAVLLAAALPARAAGDPVYSDWFGLAIRGYDPVAYFTEERPVEGDRAHSLEWKGATWRFASAEHRAMFEADPEAYAPQYGGYCAYAVAQGGTASVDPEQWRIVDGKLYLNYDASVQERWLADIPGHISKADANWPGVLE
ncbi:MAG TPA: YHS domain-containing (seleno)protein [Paracoccaceae bacterium]|nr:YHS domain-containing (seleno)protein [Paracoccaceae bacterium]